MDRAFFVYILTNADRGVLYTGVTNDLIRRAYQHREGLNRGFTRCFNCDRLVWFEMHGEVGPAIIREKLIKRWRRDWKIAMIEAGNPDWLDLWPMIIG